MSRSRDYTRAQLDRMKVKVSRYDAVKCEPTPERIGKYAVTRAKCSCYMCGNPRYIHGETTMQERRNGIGDGGYWS